MRSLRELDTELARHNLLFGRTEEKSGLCRLLTSGVRGVLLHGPGGMGKTTLMLHALRDLGGMGGGTLISASAVLDSGHSFYFEDLEAFVRFLGVRKRPLTLLQATITFKWDEGGERVESSIRVGGGEREARGTMISASSSVFQTERLVVRTALDVAVGPRFEAEEVTKKVEPVLERFSEDIGRAVERARRGPGANLPGDVEGETRGEGDAVPAKLAAAVAGMMSRSVRDGDREHGVVRNFLEEELATLVEECNREVYLSASSFLRPDDGPARRLSLREFEDGLQQFLESSNLDGLVPGELTFWRWYFGIDHLERGVPGWTLDVKRQAVRMIYEKMSERDGLHVLMAIEPDPALITGRLDQGRARLDREGDGFVAVPVSMPPREEFVREASDFIVENVEDVGGLRHAAVHKVIADLYDHCSGRVRLYYLVRNIKNLPALHELGVGQVEPDASFLDRQLGDALGQLGVRYEYDMSIKNLPAVKPLLELARIEGETTGEDGDIASKNVVGWLLDVYSDGNTLDTRRYLDVMEAYGILRVTGDRVGFYDGYVGWELRLLSRSMEAADRPLVLSFQSTNRLNHLLVALDLKDLLSMSGHVAAVLSNWSSTARADPGIHRSLLTALEGGGDFPERRRKIAVLSASAVLGGVAFAPEDEERQRERTATLIRDLVTDGDHALASLMTRALRKMTEREGGRKCALCGSAMEEGQSICRGCRTDFREVCPSCGQRVSPHFAYCAGCGAAISWQSSPPRS